MLILSFGQTRTVLPRLGCKQKNNGENRMNMKHGLIVSGLLLLAMSFGMKGALALPNTPACRAYANYARSAGASGTYGPLVQKYKACLRSANHRGPAPQVKYPPRYRNRSGSRPKVRPSQFKNYRKYQKCVAYRTSCDKRCLRGILAKRLSHNAGIRCYQRCGAYKRLSRCERLYGR